MSEQQIGLMTAGCFVIVACVGVMVTSRLARAIHDASWSRFGVPFRPRLARTGVIGAGALGVLVGSSVVVLALTAAAS